MRSSSDQLTQRARQWEVEIEKVFETETSLIAFGFRSVVPIVLKIIKKQSDEWHSGDVLRAFAGDGVVRVFESESGAVLLELLTPGNDLVNMVREGKDEEATEILAQVMRQMANHAPPDSCPTVFDWMRGFDRYLNTGDERVPVDLVHEAHDLYRSLASSSPKTMLLHGDFHHYNVLLDANRGAVAIDPKGVVGELEYEVGAILRNPMELPRLFTSSAVIERRLRMLTEALHLDYQRAMQWSFAQGVLSAIWEVEDGHQVEHNHPALNLARTIRTMLR